MDRYQEVADDLAARIERGEWLVGDQLPGQRVLAEHYGCSDRVCREAQSLLAVRGFVRVVERKGVFIADRGRPRHHLDLGTTISRNELGYFRNRHAGHWPPVPGSITRGEVPCPPDVASLLGVAATGLVFARRRVVGPSEAEPMQITTTYFPLDLVTGTVLAEQDTGPGGWMDRVEHDLAHGPLDWPVQLIARLPTTQEAHDLLMPEQLPVWAEMCQAIGAGGDVLAVDAIVRDSQRWTIGYRLERDDSAAWPTQPATERNAPHTRADTPGHGSATAEPTSSGPKG